MTLKMAVLPFGTLGATLRTEHPRRPYLDLYSPDTFHDIINHYMWGYFLT
jgi:hypothetical protein